MRVLWFTNTPSNFGEGGSKYNGGGWVSSLEEALREKVELGVCFISKDPGLFDGQSHVHGKAKWFRSLRHSVMYYPVLNGYDITRGDRTRSLLLGEGKQIESLLSCYREVVEDFSPSVIQVFGSEHSFGLVAGETTVPVVLHLQGLMNPYWEVFTPKGVSIPYWTVNGGPLSSLLQRVYTLSRWKRSCERERKILSLVSNYMGRTRWDREQVRSLRGNDTWNYFKVWEMLRSPFYGDVPTERKLPPTLRLVTTISEPPYKGMDVLLRAGKALRDSGVQFEWRVFGNISPSFFVKMTGISVQEAGLTLCGVIGPAKLREELLSCTMYVHPSYIDNSPNSVCEAQILGVPVLAAAVGGVPSLIEDAKTGFLFPAGDSEALSEKIRSLDGATLKEVGRAARECALVRHDRDSIVSSILNVYDLLSVKN